MKLIRRHREVPLITTVIAFTLAFVFLVSGAAQGAVVDSQPPTSPSQLHVTNNWGDCAFEFRWDASTDDQSVDIAYAFVVDGTIDPNYSWQENTTHRIWGDCMVYPPANGTYTIQVVARDAVGNLSEPSNAITVTVRLWG
jgi:hypothetical protein